MGIRIKFNCAKCNRPYEKDSSDVYKQRKKYGENYCKVCGYKIGMQNSTKTKYGSIRSYDIIQIPCSICGKIRIITRNSAKFSNRCHNCSSSENSKKLWLDPNFKLKISLAVHNFWINNRQLYMKVFQTNKFKNKLSNISIELWKSEEFRKKMYEIFESSKFKQKLSNSTTELWKTKEFRESMQLIYTSDEFKKRMSKTSKEYYVQNKEKIIERLKSEKVLKRLREVCSTKEHRDRTSINSIKLWQRDEYRQKLLKSLAISRFKSQISQKSKIQDILYSILDDLKIKYIKEYPIGYYNIDCFIPIKYLLIEVQGDYWHSLEKNIRRDKSKATYLKTYFPEYDLKYLWEHEFDNKDRIINLLKYWLGIKNQELINFNFKDIQERIIDYKEAELFISKYHYAGRIGRSGINLGYYLGDELITTIIYVNPTRQETATKQGMFYKEVLELNRLAIHPQYQVKNLASHLISRSINYIKQSKPEIKLLVSFADSTFNHDGTIYKASNWILSGEVLPDYWYADDRGYICHKKTLWNKASSLKMTESEYCLKFNYMKVWGEKKFRYLYKIS